MTTDILITILFVISLVVAVSLLITHTAPWGLVTTYWITLTIKNALDNRRFYEREISES